MLMTVKKEILFPQGDNKFTGFRSIEDCVDYKGIIQGKTSVKGGGRDLNFRFVNPSGVRDEKEKQIVSYFTVIRRGIGENKDKVYLFTKSIIVPSKDDKKYPINGKIDSIVFEDPVYLLDAKKAEKDNGKTLEVAAERAINSKINLSNYGTFDCVGFVNFDEGPYSNLFGIMYFVNSAPPTSKRKSASGRQTRALDLDLKAKVEIIELEKLVQASEVDGISILLFEPLRDYLLKKYLEKEPNSF